MVEALQQAANAVVLVGVALVVVTISLVAVIGDKRWHYHACCGGNSCRSSSKSDSCDGSSGSSRRIAWELWW